MKIPVALIFLLLSGLCTQAQDSTRHVRYETLMDSITSLSAQQYSFDSLNTLTWADSLKSKINLQYRLDSLGVHSKMDSLRNLGQVTVPYKDKLDSLLQKKEALLQEVETKKQDVLSKTKGRLESWETKVREKLGLIKVPDNVQGLPQTDLPDVANGLSAPEMGIPAMDLPEIPALSAPELQNLDLSPDLSAINQSVSLPEWDGLQNIQDKLGKGGEALSTVSSLTTDTDNVIDASLNNVSELGEVKDQLQLGEGIADNELMETAGKMKDPNAMKEELKQQVVKKAVNHFEGKEEVLKQAMEKMSKYKAKYESLNSLSEIKKRPPNPMKGKPFIERLVPGVAFQILKHDDLFLDVNPYVGYRITGRLTSGLGWNQRIGYSTRYDYFTSASVIYGPRMFTEFKVWKGFSARAELEVMNAFVPPLFKTALSDNGHREWVLSTFVGIKKEYRFMKSVKGTAFVMFNLFDYRHRSPYGDVINSRFGFEFPMKKKKKKD